MCTRKSTETHSSAKECVASSLALDDGTYHLCALLAAQCGGVVSLVPLPERSGVDLNNAVLHQCLGSHQFVVARIVDDVNDTSFPCLR